MNSGYCSFIIKGIGLSFNEIEDELGIKASKKFVEGKITSKVIGKNEFDLIRFDKEIDDEHTPNQTLDDILNIMLPHEDYIKNMQKKHDVSLKCFVQSDSAQVNYRIAPDIMSKLVRVGIDLEISVLSWGGTDAE